MIYTYKILSILLDYPSSQTKNVLDECIGYINKENILDKRSKKNLQQFIDAFKEKDILDWQESYSSLFDCTPVSSLYIFDHVYGDSKMRGMAMVDLKQLYSSEGMDINSSELPDYLPLYLEFLSNLKDINQVYNLTGEIEHIISKIGKSLSSLNSEYGYLFNILSRLASKGECEKISLEEKQKIENFRACESCYFTSEEYYQSKNMK
ncbi:MAG: nitrate reductase molybdenum cofactor assembly chaperone [Bacteroidales bacterium]|nr:nitrate reductase molybdenum cofactor assembly chaperone [Bacteroidales bacterium]